ncbi:MAG: hypothetical protein AB7O59_22400 [Pirellulales bacterium]
MQTVHLEIDESTVAEFLKRLGHAVAIVGVKPTTANTPPSSVKWPAEQTDILRHVARMSRYYYSVYVNLNPLRPEILSPKGSVRDNRIASRTRVLIDIDGHDVPKEVAREQKDAIKVKLGEPLIETDSGNGYGLIYPCDMPNDQHSKHVVRTLLNTLKAEFPCVDASCFNAGRLTRLIGTPNVRDGVRIPTELLNV